MSGHRSGKPNRGQPGAPLSVHTPPTEAETVIPFARMPHGIASDKRLKTADVRVVLALLYWACQKTWCDMSAGKLAEYLHASVPTVDRSIRRLKRLGYIRCEELRPDRNNWTGRRIVLVWVENPSIIPEPPDRRSIISDRPGPSFLTDPVHHERWTGSIISDRPGPSRMMDKEESSKEVEKEGKTKTTGGPVESSSSSDDIPLPGGGEPEDVEGVTGAVEAVEAVEAVFPGTPAAKVAGLCKLADVGCVIAAAKIVGGKNRRGAVPKTWAYLRSTAIKMKGEGGPAGEPSRAAGRAVVADPEKLARRQQESEAERIEAEAARERKAVEARAEVERRQNRGLAPHPLSHPVWNSISPDDPLRIRAVEFDAKRIVGQGMRWLYNQPDSFRAAFEEKSSGWQEAARAKIEAAGSPDLVGAKIYGELGLTYRADDSIRTVG